jgi:hypothetical protein
MFFFSSTRSAAKRCWMFRGWRLLAVSSIETISHTSTRACSLAAVAIVMENLQTAEKNEKKSPLWYISSHSCTLLSTISSKMLVSLFRLIRVRTREIEYMFFFLFSVCDIFFFSWGNEEHSKLEHKKEWEGESDYYIAPSLSTPSAKWFVFIIILFVLWHSRVLWLKQLVFNIKFFSLYYFFSLMLVVTIFFCLCLFIIVIPIKLFSFFIPFIASNKLSYMSVHELIWT